jgi:colanic acid biosynthesis glycosyl transferase WcaI
VACAARGADNVIFKPYQPRENLSESLSVADAHLISLDPGCEGLIVPSKYYGVAAVARSVLYLGDVDGAIAREIKVEGEGVALTVDGASDWERIVRDFIAATESKRQREITSSCRRADTGSLPQWRGALVEVGAANG